MSSKQLILSKIVNEVARCHIFYHKLSLEDLAIHYISHTHTRALTQPPLHMDLRTVGTAWVCLLCMSPFVHMKIIQNAATCCLKGG